MENPLLIFHFSDKKEDFSCFKIIILKNKPNFIDLYEDHEIVLLYKDNSCTIPLNLHIHGRKDNKNNTEIEDQTNAEYLINLYKFPHSNDNVLKVIENNSIHFDGSGPKNIYIIEINGVDCLKHSSSFPNTK